MVAPTLALVPLAPVAQAAIGFSPTFYRTGAAVVGLERYSPNPVTGNTQVIASVEDLTPDTTNDLPPASQPSYHHAPGGSFTLRLEWSSTRSGGASGEASQAEVYFVDSAGSQIGTTKWTVNLTNVDGSSTRAMHFDTDPIDGNADDAERSGNMFLYVKLVGTGPGVGAGSGQPYCGDTATEYTNDWEVCGVGIFSAGYMIGLDDDRGKSAFDTAEANVGKDFQAARSFISYWDLPPSDVTTYASDHRMVIYSVKSKNSGSHNNFTQTSSPSWKSRWRTVADGDQDSGTYGLIAQIQSLASTASTYSVPIVFSIWHEPHDDVDGCQTSGCNGTEEDYRDMYAHLRVLMEDYGNKWLKIAYIAVDSKMITGSPVGATDYLRPDDGDYDLLGPDLYNYYRWKSGAGNQSQTVDPATWKNPSYSSKIGLASDNGLLKLAINHGKHLIFPEVGTHPGCPGGGTGTADGTVGHCLGGETTHTKDEYFRDFATKITTNSDYQKWVIGWVYFHHSPTNTGSSALYDWSFTNRTNTNNSEASCPNANCWTGTTGWQDAFVNDNASYNNHHEEWFVGGSGTQATFIP
jgi:hypothetical protein